VGCGLALHGMRFNQRRCNPLSVLTLLSTLGGFTKFDIELLTTTNKEQSWKKK
jgi:hypothetical protein